LHAVGAALAALSVLLLAATVCVALGASPAGAADTASAELPRVERVGPHLYRLGTVLLDAEAREVRCPGRVNMQEGGPIELLACLPHGKTHESVFALDIAALDLQLALLLLDLHEGVNPAVPPADGAPDAQVPPGDAVRITVEWADDGSAEDEEPHRAPAGRFLRNVQTDSVLGRADWVFLGSIMTEDGLAAGVTGTLVTTFHDPVAVLELAHETVNEDVYYFVNERLCPPVGTPVELIIRDPAEDQDGTQVRTDTPDATSRVQTLPGP
jgi:hypothetical protein